MPAEAARACIGHWARSPSGASPLPRWRRRGRRHASGRDLRRLRLVTALLPAPQLPAALGISPGRPPPDPSPEVTGLDTPQNSTTNPHRAEPQALVKLRALESPAILTYDLDRVARDPRDLEDLIDVVESRDPRMSVESVTGSLRLTTDADVTMARVMVAVANKASRDTARRVTRKHVQLAEQGKPGGGGFRGYGYDHQGLHIGPPTPRSSARSPPASSAPETATPQNSSPPSIPPAANRSAPSPKTCAAAKSPASQGRPGTTVPSGEAVWPAILDRQTWEDVCARVVERGSQRDGKLKRWLTNVFRCSKCGHMLTGPQGKPGDGPRYWCATTKGGCGKIAITAIQAEKEIERQILNLLGHPRVLERLRTLTTTEHTAEARKTRRRRAGVEGACWHVGTKADPFPRVRRGPRHHQHPRQGVSGSARIGCPRILRALLVGDIAENWERLEPSEKREVVLAITPGFDVLPFNSKTMRGFDASRLHPRTPELEAADGLPGKLIQLPTAAAGG